MRWCAAIENKIDSKNNVLWFWNTLHLQNASASRPSETFQIFWISVCDVRLCLLTGRAPEDRLVKSIWIHMTHMTARNKYRFGICYKGRLMLYPQFSIMGSLPMAHFFLSHYVIFYRNKVCAHCDWNCIYPIEIHVTLPAIIRTEHQVTPETHFPSVQILQLRNTFPLNASSESISAGI